MRIPFLGDNISWLKGFFLFYLLVIVIFVAAAPFLTLWLYSETSVTRTLLPQLIGFCIEGGFMVVLFAFYEKRVTVDSRRAWKYTLRTFLSPLVDFCLADLSLERQREPGMLPSPVVMQLGVDVLRERGLSAGQVARAHEIAAGLLLSMHSLSVVAAQIDHAHLEAWMSLLRALRDLEQASDPVEVARVAARLLEEVVRFDELLFL